MELPVKPATQGPAKSKNTPITGFWRAHSKKIVIFRDKKLEESLTSGNDAFLGGNSMAKKTKFNLITQLHEGILKTAQATRTGTVRIKRSDLKNLIETTFIDAAKIAAKGERVRFPVIGALVRKEVAAKKGGVKTTNPFTGEPMVTKSRPATKKPRWSFPKSLKETFANKRNW